MGNKFQDLGQALNLNTCFLEQRSELCLHSILVWALSNYPDLKIIQPGMLSYPAPFEWLLDSLSMAPINDPVCNLKRKSLILTL